jgi:ABC-type microcin C transport system duplicated ATPase subunit YejF
VGRDNFFLETFDIKSDSCRGEACLARLFAAPQAAYTRELLDAIPLPDPDQVWT